MTTTEAPTTTPIEGTPIEAPETSTATPSAAPAERTMSIVALVLAIASLVLGYTFLVPAAAIVLGFLAHRREPAGRNLATWSIILGFLAIFGWIIIAALGVAAITPFFLFSLI